MLISLSFENWMSYLEPTSFSMVASRERQHGERVPKLPKYNARVLPVAAIHGGNASGKTNFFKALHFARSFILRGTAPEGLIGVEPCRLAAGADRRPTRFAFELLIDETVHAYSFAVTRTSVIEEKLVVITSTSERVLFERRGADLQLDRSLARDEYLRFAHRGTRENQLFLTNSVSQKIDTFRPVFDWFRNCLEMVAPDARFDVFDLYFDEQNALHGMLNDLLPQLDTGIVRLGSERIPIETLPVAESVKVRLHEDVREGMTVRVPSDASNDRFVVTRRGGELIARKLVTFHETGEGVEERFEMRHESDGTQRVLDLLPAFLDLSAPGSRKVYVIDEIDRSLHTLLSRHLLECYLETCSADTRSQLLFTTHDALLMDQSIFRRDEMWVTERTTTGGTRIISLSDFKDVRYDKDVRRSYLHGRLGGIPSIVRGSAFTHPSLNGDSGEHA